MSGHGSSCPENLFHAGNNNPRRRVDSLPEIRRSKRTFTVAAVEMKGGVTVDKEPFPTDALPAGPGYVLNKPDQTGRWEVSVYMWMPGQIIVNQDDDVTLEFVGINGANHPTTIVGYDKSFVLKR